MLLATVWAVRLVRLARSVTTYAQYWGSARGEPGGLRYVALGDSAAQGIGAAKPDCGYVGLLARRMRDSSGRPVEVVNLSRTGARLDDVVEEQLPALAALGYEPDLVTVAVGGNDVRGYDRDRFNGAVERLTAALPAGAYVADVPFFGGGRWGRHARAAGDLLRASAVRRGLHPVALHAALERQGPAAVLTQFAADWFHPNDRGHRVWADAFWSAIRTDPVLQPGAGRSDRTRMHG